MAITKSECAFVYSNKSMNRTGGTPSVKKLYPTETLRKSASQILKG